VERSPAGRGGVFRRGWQATSEICVKEARGGPGEESMIGRILTNCRRARLGIVLAIPLAAVAANYEARRATVDSREVVILTDAAHEAEVRVLPLPGNVAYEMKVKGKDVFYVPPTPTRGGVMQTGIPILWPWGNRLDQDAFYANGKKYNLNEDLKNVHRDQNKHPMHGLLTGSSAWKVVSVTADDRSAAVTSRLEFWKYPDLMAQFPFAHTIEMTYRLRDGVLEVETVLQNLSIEPMPVTIGFHPYFQIPGVPREQWQIHLPARDHLVETPELLPTGEREPMKFADSQTLGDLALDDVFTNLVRNAEGRSEWWVEVGKQRVTVLFGPKYLSGVVWAPKGRNLIVFEPLAAITNALNLAQTGVYKELQSVPPGSEWRESFWVRTSGF
jgi:aldose 1-epimerase